MPYNEKQQPPVISSYTLVPISSNLKKILIFFSDIFLISKEYINTDFLIHQILKLFINLLSVSEMIHWPIMIDENLVVCNLLFPWFLLSLPLSIVTPYFVKYSFTFLRPCKCYLMLRQVVYCEYIFFLVHLFS